MLFLSKPPQLDLDSEVAPTCFFCIEDFHGNTPLHCAALGGDKQITNKLIEAGVDLDASNHELDKPIHLAASVGNLDVLKALLDAGANLQGRGWLDNTALHVACQSAQVNKNFPQESIKITTFKVKIIHELLQRGLPHDVVNAHGEHPIHLAAGAHRSDNNIEHVEILLEAGVNIKKARTNEGCTAAHYAAKVEIKTILCNKTLFL